MHSIEIEKRKPDAAGQCECFVLHDWTELPPRLPPPGGAVTFVTYRCLSAFELLPILLASGTCDRCLLSTFNLSAKAGSYLEALLTGGRVKLLDVVLAEAMSRLGEGGGLAMMVDAQTRFPGRLRVRQADVHAKVYCLAMSSGDNWVVECSANLAANSRIELYAVWNSEARLLWHASWLGRLLR